MIFLLGCTHSWVINILNKVCEKTKTDKVFALIGGMHLESKTPEQIKKSLKNLKISMFK